MMALSWAVDVSRAHVTVSVQGWVNHMRYGNSVGLRQAVLGQVQ
jgi:hypothetical protein